ncbi:4'-phosphopantetheinyl transferase superfamily protein [Oxalobacteraceae bacterium]|nr:4'-phosphopantetheinyl transferase superfamily protein [Oxalobacteraceae bacterium]
MAPNASAGTACQPRWLCQRIDMAAGPDAGPVDGCVLSAAELAAAARLLRPGHAQDYLASHRALRHWLAEGTGIAPAQLRFSYNEHGKPQADPPHYSFSFSHSGGYWAGALASPAQQAGIDIEQIVRFDRITPAMLAYMLSAQERVRWHTAPPPCPASALALLWTRKEALLKAIGCGLRRAMHQVCVGWECGPAPVPVRSADLAGQPALWMVRELDGLPAGLAGALAWRLAPGQRA